MSDMNFMFLVGWLVLVFVAGKYMRISRFLGKFSLEYVHFEVPHVQPGGGFSKQLDLQLQG